VDALCKNVEIRDVKIGMNEGNRVVGRGIRDVPDKEVAYRKSRRR
jgi:hypothetical protein